MHRRALIRLFSPAALAMGLILAGCGPARAPAKTGEEQVVRVYSSRHYAADKALYAAFTEATGIKVETTEAGGEELLARLKQEGEASPADLIVTVDAGNLWRLTQEGLLQPHGDAEIDQSVPARFRDPNGMWVGFSKRARVIAYAPARISAAQVASLDDLTAPRLRGKVCARTSSNVYNLSLLASRIERTGPDAALAWARGVAANLRRNPPEGNDTAQLYAVAAGECDVALVNHYYLLRLRASTEARDVAAAAALAMVFPDQAGAGTHINISGAGIARHAKNRDAAVALLRFLVSVRAQGELGALNEEFPIRTDVQPAPALAALGAFREEDVPLTAFGARQAEALALYERAGWR